MKVIPRGQISFGTSILSVWHLRSPGRKGWLCGSGDDYCGQKANIVGPSVELRGWKCARGQSARSQAFARQANTHKAGECRAPPPPPDRSTAARKPAPRKASSAQQAQSMRKDALCTCSLAGALGQRGPLCITSRFGRQADGRAEHNNEVEMSRPAHDGRLSKEGLPNARSSPSLAGMRRGLPL
jgi:hypothetical protein